MVGLVVVALVLLSWLFSGVSGIIRSRDQGKQSALMDSFDKVLSETTDIQFTSKELVKTEEIKDYEAHVNPRYIVLRDVDRMFINLVDFVDLSPKEQKAEIRKLEEKIKVEEEDGSADANALSIDGERLTWMLVINKGMNESAISSLERRVSEVRDSLDLMTKRSNGWKYIIDATYSDSTICRFVMVAPESNPNELHMAGGRLLSMEEKQQDIEKNTPNVPFLKKMIK